MPMVRDREDDRTTRRWTWFFLGVLAAIPPLAIFSVIMAFDPNDHKAFVIEQVRRATGRELRLDGPIHLKLALRPTVEARDVGLGNMPGGTAPEMVRAGRVEARIGLIGLLQQRLDIDRLTVEQPSILLESDAEGRGNWRFTPEVQRLTARDGLALDIREIRVQGGELTFIRHGEAPIRLPLRSLDVDAETATAPMGVKAEFVWQGEPVSVTGQVGSFAVLQGISSAAWPVRLNATLAGGRLALTGSLGLSASSPSYQLAFAAELPDLRAAGALLGADMLPPLRDVAASLSLRDRGREGPEVTELSLRAGEADLAAIWPATRLKRLELSAPRLDAVLRLEAEGHIGPSPFALGASLASPQALLRAARLGTGSAGALPIEINATVAAAALSLRGRIADPISLSGLDAALTATVPDLAALTPALGRDLPALRDLRLQARLAERDGALLLRELRYTHPGTEIAGELGLRFLPRPSISGDLAATQLDLDALRAVLPAAETAAAQGGSGRGLRVIPDLRLSVTPLRLVDADLRLRIDTLIHAGTTIRQANGDLRLRQGRLRLEPFSAEFPAGPLAGRIGIDADRFDPLVSVALRSPGLSVEQLYRAIGRQGEASGTVELDLDLRGSGTSLRGVMARASGHLGLAMVGGRIDNRMIGPGLIGDVLRFMGAGEALGTGGSQVRCLALRLDAREGIGEFRTLLIDASTLQLEGEGRLNLADEALALRLRVLPRLLGLGVAVPVRVGGILAAPRVSPDPGGVLGAAGQTASGLASTITGLAGAGVGAAGGALGAPGAAQGVPAPPDACAGQLAIARGGRAGALPPPRTAAETPARRRGGENPLRRVLP